MFYMDENILDDSRALVSIQGEKRDIKNTLKTGMINYAVKNSTLWLTTPEVRANISNGKWMDKFDRIITAREGLVIEGSFNFKDDQFFKSNVTIDKDLLIKGNLSVLGESTVIDTPRLTIEDNIIEINKNETSDHITLIKSGIGINRGTSGFVRYLFDDFDNSFVLDKTSEIDRDTDSWVMKCHIENHEEWKAGDVRVNRKIYTPYLDVTSDMEVKNNALIKNLEVSHNTLLKGDTIIDSNNTINGPSVFNGTIISNNLVTFNKPFVSNDTVTFNKPFTANDISTFNKKVTINANTDIVDGELNVKTRDAIFHENINVKKNVLIENNTTINNDLLVKNNIKCSKKIEGQNIRTEVDFIAKAMNGNGLAFWDSNDSKIFMNSKIETVAGTEDSDFNMYFRMKGGTNRGFVFTNGTDALMQVQQNGMLNVKDNMYSKESLVLTEAMEGEGNGIDADTVDGKHSRDLVLRDGTQEMLGNFLMSNHKIIWEENNDLYFKKASNINGTDRSGAFVLAANEDSNDTTLEVGALKLNTLVLDYKDNSITGIKNFRSLTGDILTEAGKIITINGSKAYDEVNFTDSIIRTSKSINIGNDGEILKANKDNFMYKNKEVVTTAGTPVMYGDINMAAKKLRFSTKISELNQDDNKYSEIYSTHENDISLMKFNIGKNPLSKYEFTITDTTGDKKLLEINKDKTIFTDVPYHLEDRILTVADEGHGNNLDADTVDGKHLVDLSDDFIDADGDTMRGDLFFDGATKAIFGNNETYINKDNELNIVSDTNIKFAIGAEEAVLKTDGTMTLSGERVLTIADEGHENLLDADTVDNIHANQFVRRDTCSVMEADIDINSNALKFNEGSISNNDTSKTFTLEQADVKLNVCSDANNKNINVMHGEKEVLKSTDGSLFINGEEVWHTGNLTPAEYEKIEYEVVETLDPSTVETTSKIIAKVFVDVHPKVNAIGGYIETVVFNSENKMQKVTSMDGKYILQRSKHNNTYGKFVIIAAKQTFTKDLDITSWKLENEMHYTDIEHDLIYEGITSVCLTDADGFSITTGFKELNETTIRIYSVSKIQGKANINVSLS